MAAGQDEFALVREGVVLATDTMEHHLGNRLACTVANCELLCEDPRLPEDLRRRALAAMNAAYAAAETLQKLRQITRLERDRGVTGVTILALEDTLP